MTLSVSDLAGQFFTDRPASGLGSVLGIRQIDQVYGLRVSTSNRYLLLLACRLLRSEVLRNFGSAFVGCPAHRRTLPKRIFQIQPSAAIHKQTDDALMPACGGLMQWC
jgi:hypothetical protein